MTPLFKTPGGTSDHHQESFHRYKEPNRSSPTAALPDRIVIDGKEFRPYSFTIPDPTLSVCSDDDFSDDSSEDDMARTKKQHVEPQVFIREPRTGPPPPPFDYEEWRRDHEEQEQAYNAWEAQQDDDQAEFPIEEFDVGAGTSNAGPSTEEPFDWNSDDDREVDEAIAARHAAAFSSLSLGHHDEQLDQIGPSQLPRVIHLHPSPRMGFPALPAPSTNQPMVEESAPESTEPSEPTETSRSLIRRRGPRLSPGSARTDPSVHVPTRHEEIMETYHRLGDLLRREFGGDASDN